MWVCEKCGAIKGGQYDKCMVCSLAGEIPEPPRRLPGPPVPYRFLPIIEDNVPLPQVGMPRRFSIGTLMILTVFFALLFGILKMCSVPPVVFIAITLFIAGVAVCQAVLYGGKNPRKASFVGGIAMYGLLTLVAALVEGYRHGDMLRAIELSPCSTIGVVIAGGSLGYIAGCLIAGVFLLRKEPDDTEPAAEEPAEHGP
jgi:hypothetical protein